MLKKKKKALTAVNNTEKPGICRKLGTETKLSWKKNQGKKDKGNDMRIRRKL